MATGKSLFKKQLTPLVNTAFSFLQQVLQQEPDAREQLLQMLQSEIPVMPAVSDQQKSIARKPKTMYQLCVKIDAKQEWTKQEWTDALTHYVNFKKLPKSLEEFYKYHLSKKQ